MSGRAILLVVSPDGATMLVDAGGPVGGVTEAAEATSRFDVGEEVVSPYLWSRRIRRLDVIALEPCAQRPHGRDGGGDAELSGRESCGSASIPTRRPIGAAGGGEGAWSGGAPSSMRGISLRGVGRR